MSCWLKQSTAVDIAFGPFLDSTDGNTVESALTITQPDIRLKKNGGAWAQKSAAQTLSHEENGWYEISLSTTDTDTLGILIVAVHESGALPVWREFLVVSANIYDSFFSTDFLQVDLTQMGGVTQSATDLKDFADDGYDPSTNKVQGVVLADTITTYTGNTPQTGDSFARIGATGSGLTSLASQSSVNTIDDFLDTEITDIRDRLPAALVGGKMDSITSIRAGTAQQGSASVIRLDASASGTDDFYNRNVIFLLSGTGALQPPVRVVDYNGTNKDASVAPNFLVNPDNTSVFVIMPASLLNMYLGAQ